MKQEEFYKPIILKIESEIPKLFPTEHFSIAEVVFNGKIIVAVVKFKDLKALAKNWKEINSFVTAKYIANFENEFSKWNFYMFYLVPGLVDKPLQYEIENNKFSSRKVVIDNFQKKVLVKDIKEIISEHITNDNIFLSTKENEIKPFTKNVSLSQVIDKISFSKAKKDKEDILSKALDQIEKFIKNEV